MDRIQRDRDGNQRISVVMPMHNGARNLDRAISSLIQQSFHSWELLVVDDGSTDGGPDRLRLWARQDDRIRPVFRPDCRGSAAARNIGVQRATGATIAHLDCDDEYHVDFLEKVAEYRDRADVLIFGYDSVLDREGGCIDLAGGDGSGSPQGELFGLGGTIVRPLGVAHRCAPALRVGGFDENLWWDETGDLWKRMARSGATFFRVPSKSGRYHLREGTSRLTPTILPHQRCRAEANFHAGKTLYQNGCRSVAGRPGARRVIFASAHSLLDCSSGAAVASLDLLGGLAATGCQCQAFCTPRLDFHREVCFERMIGEMGDHYEIWPSLSGTRRARVLYTRRRQVPVTFVLPVSEQPQMAPTDQVATVLEFFRELLESCRPDVMLTYGWDPITCGMIALARRMDIPVVFAIHNFAYTSLRPFWNVDYCIVPSEFARRYYWENVGLACQALPNPVDWDRVLARDRVPRYVTFVNPSREKGVYAFARIASELERRRPDIPLLVVEGRATRDTLAACCPDRRVPGNVAIMPNTPDPRRFWGVTRITLVPSLWWENQPAVVYESLINGIPVIGSDRGGTPETLGDSGFLLPLPERLTPESDILPTAEEVEPWIETIIRLWDDRALYEDQCARARNEARRWHADRLRPLHAAFFREACPQPGPPFLPRAGREARLWV